MVECSSWNTQPQGAPATEAAALDRLAALVRASEALTTSGDYPRTLQRLARLAVPHLADWCVLDVVEPDGTWNRVAVAHADAAKKALAEELRKATPADADAAWQWARPLRRPRSRSGRFTPIVRRIDDADAPDNGLLRRLGFRSLLIIPLVSASQLVGYLTLAMAESGRDFSAADQLLGQALAQQCGLVVENARLQQQLQEGLRTRDRLLSIASHELKAPIAVIQGYAEILANFGDGARDDETTRALEAITRQCGRLQRLVRELLEISRLQLGGLELLPRRFDLRELTSEVVEQMQLSAPLHRLLVRAEGAVEVIADRYRIEHVLINLLSNAIKFSPQGGDVEAIVREDEGFGVVSIRDYGVGIPKNRQARVFEEFYSPHKGTEYEYGGMGVGLYLSREFIKRNGGHIWFESEEGKGSTFSFSLPLATGQEASIARIIAPAIETEPHRARSAILSPAL